jgi:hypothetical protein
MDQESALNQHGGLKKEGNFVAAYKNKRASRDQCGNKKESNFVAAYLRDNVIACPEISSCKIWKNNLLGEST